MHMKEITYAGFAIGIIGGLLMIWSSLLSDEVYDFDCDDADYLDDKYENSSEGMELCEKDRSSTLRTALFTDDLGYAMVLIGLILVIGANKVN